VLFKIEPEESRVLSSPPTSPYNQARIVTEDLRQKQTHNESVEKVIFDKIPIPYVL
jgi:hypothetical protein